VGLLLARIEDPDTVADQWRTLAEARGNAFVTPEWFSAWNRRYGELEPSVVVARDDDGGTVRGILPLARGRSGRSRLIRFEGAAAADHFHPAASAEDEAAVAAVCGAVLATEPDWGVIILDNVDAGARWTAALADAAGDGLAVRTYRHAVLPRIDLSETSSWEDFLRRRSRNFRSQMRRFEAGLERDHALRFRATQTQEELDSDLDTFFSLQDARWRGRGGSSSASPQVRAFHHDFASRALDRGWLRLWFLELGGEPAAAWYGWRLGDRYSFYLSGFEPRYARLRVGLVLLAHTIRSAIEEGAGDYDLLLGDEPYKSRFANSRRNVESVLIARPGAPNALAAAETTLWRLSRRLPEARRRQLREALAGLAERLPGARRR
jgi:CelD/BcsL family acetyltransferase involved in cellulose biosynthesis